VSDSVVGRHATARVPATSANLGPGFDAFGLSLSLYDDLSVTATGSGLVVEVAGEGAGAVPRDEGHLVIAALRATLDVIGVSQPGLTLTAVNRIPHGRGLGSSAAAIVAGIRLAQGLAPDHALTDEAALSVAFDLEGHPDNVAACLLGGLTIAWTDGSRVRATRMDVDPRVRVRLLVPEQPLSTQAARAALPVTVPHEDAAANAARTGLLVAALTQQPDLLHTATEDRLHQSYRGSAMPATLELVAGLRRRELAAAVSGAGPAVLLLTTDLARSAYDDLVPVGWQVLDLGVDPHGCTWASAG
jgi:homoserine kinase